MREGLSQAWLEKGNRGRALWSIRTLPRMRLGSGAPQGEWRSWPLPNFIRSPRGWPHHDPQIGGLETSSELPKPPMKGCC